MAMVTFNAVGGAATHYARNIGSGLRNPGKKTSFRAESAFKGKLDAMFNELWKNCALGRADIVVTAGAFVDRNVAGSTKKSAHAQGRAFDIDGIIWRATDKRPEKVWYAIDFDKDAPFYWGVGGILNRHMKHVLHARYNAAHHDHYHIQDTLAPKFATGSKAQVKFLQAALTHVHATPVTIDGGFGAGTRSATAAVLARLNIAGDITTQSVWHQFNLATARIGMSANVDADVSDPDREDDDDVDVIAKPKDEHELGNPVTLKLTTPRMRGEKVKALQQALQAAGTQPGRADGIFGSRTKEAVINFQRSKNLMADGIVGPITAAALNITL